MSLRPARWLVGVPVLLAVAFGMSPTAPVLGQSSKSKTLQFCFWNVENLFDDKPHPNAKTLAGVDQEFDNWFVTNKEAREKKIERLCEVLLSKEMNEGRGPDILAMAEVESERAVELVKNALNSRLKDKTLHYTTIVYRDPEGGRSIATALLTRIPVDPKRTRLLGRAQRILKVVIPQGKHELSILATHWSSRVSDKTGRGRSNYARLVYDDFAAVYRNNPGVDYLVCGDFNDTPEDPSVVKDLNATGDLDKVLALKKGDRPLFYNPFAELAKKGKGTHFFGDKPFVFDHICLSPGLLDGYGWSYVGKSAKIVELIPFRGRPDRFGGPNDKRPWNKRGASDHFPVTIQLRVPLIVK